MRIGGQRLILSLTAAGLLSSLPGATFYALGEDPTPDPVPMERGEKLVFKHQSGKVQRFKTTAQGETKVTRGDQGPANSVVIPLNQRWTLVTTEKVTGTRQGTGTISVKVEALNLTTTILGQQMVFQTRNGKATLTLNGKPPPPSVISNRKALERYLQPQVIRRTPVGAISGKNGGLPSGLLGGSSMFYLHLPKQPIPVGEAWESLQQGRVTVPEVGEVIVTTQFTHTLKSVQTRMGKRFAIIETTGSGTSEEAASGNLTQNLHGVTRFDIARGAAVSGSYTIDLSGSAQRRSGGENQIQSKQQITILELPASPAKPTRK